MKCLKSIVLIQVMMVIAFGSYTQEKEKPVHYNSIIHAEAGGIGGYGSLNYEGVFSLSDYFSASGRVGISTLRINDFTTQFNPDLLVPITINGFYGKAHKLQVGFGQLLSNTVRASHSTGLPIRETHFHTHFSVGYRYHKEKGRMIYGISYTPMIAYQENFRHWGAVTIGYVF